MKSSKNPQVNSFDNYHIKSCLQSLGNSVKSLFNNTNKHQEIHKNLSSLSY